MHTHTLQATHEPFALARIVMDHDGAKACREQAQAIGASFLDILAKICAAPQDRHESCRLAPVAPPVDQAEPSPAPQLFASGLHQLFEAQVERTPDAVAIVAQVPRKAEAKMVRWTYRELNERANQMAHHLRAQGVGPESKVGLCVERSAEMVVALLAILKAGGAYVPFDPRHPAARLQHILTDSGIDYLVTESHLQAALPGWAGPTLCIDREALVVALQPWVNPAANVSGEQLAYILYTLGSTGEPKGIAIEHRQAVNLMRWARDRYEPAERAGVLAASSLNFDLSVFEIFMPLSWGGQVIVAEDILHLPTLGARHEVTLVNTVPSAVTPHWVEQLPASVRVVNLAGEPLKEVVVQRLHGRPTVDKVFNLYGLTETTTFATAALIPRGSTRAITIGKPIRGAEIHILDQQLQPVPVGVPGEILIGGAGLARGYLNRPELDRERFIAHPFRPDGGARLYRSGDLGRWLPDGSIEYLGRLDRQLELRGMRIDLSELEAVLLRHPSVEDAVVVACEDEVGEPFLAAYLVTSDQGAGIGSHCHDLLKQHLPACRLPQSFMVLHRLPLNLNGKVDHRALPQPQRAPSPL